MDKEWARKFYKNKSWRDCRESYYTSKHGLCEICNGVGEEVHHLIFLTQSNIKDPNISLNHNNLMLLCKPCHNKQHEKAFRKHNRKQNITSNETAFNSNGELISQKRITVVHGAPASGKTTYVNTNKKEYDIVVDMDAIIKALGDNEDAVPFALDIVEYMHESLGNSKYYFEHAWVITTMSDPNKRNQLIKRLNADVVHIKADIDICIMRARADAKRKDKGTQLFIINKYFQEYEE